MSEIKGVNKNLGFDYGIRPHFIVVGDMEFPSLIEKAGFHGLAYLHVPQFGLLVNPPSVALLFENKDSGRECFMHFKHWADGSDDGDAVGVSFVEFDDGTYAVCIYQEEKRLIARCIHERIRPEITPIFMFCGRLLRMGKKSDHFECFKRQVADAPFVLLPATKEGGPIMELGIRKREVAFYDEHNVPANSMAASLLRAPASGAPDRERRPYPEEIRQTASDIMRRRRTQMARFFPVTLERLRFSSEIQDVRKRILVAGYRDWQITQALCNLTFHHRIGGQRPGDAGSAPDAASRPLGIDQLEYLLGTQEDIHAELAPMGVYDPGLVEEQIRADAVALFAHVSSPDPPEIDPAAVQAELERLGLLNE